MSQLWSILTRLGCKPSHAIQQLSQKLSWWLLVTLSDSQGPALLPAGPQVGKEILMRTSAVLTWALAQVFYAGELGAELAIT